MDYDLKLTQQDIRVIFQGLGELPLKTSLAVFNKLQSAIAKQDEGRAQANSAAPDEGGQA